MGSFDVVVFGFNERCVEGTEEDEHGGEHVGVERGEKEREMVGVRATGWAMLKVMTAGSKRYSESPMPHRSKLQSRHQPLRPPWPLGRVVSPIPWMRMVQGLTSWTRGSCPLCTCVRAVERDRHSLTYDLHHLSIALEIHLDSHPRWKYTWKGRGTSTKA